MKLYMTAFQLQCSEVSCNMYVGEDLGVKSYLKAWSLCLLSALVEKGHRLSVEVNPGAVVRIRSLLSSSCLA